MSIKKPCLIVESSVVRTRATSHFLGAALSKVVDPVAGVKARR
jgi:hypothetical protein